ncbi:hypothetical protein [Vibrio sp. LaRot3]|uniref:hypothetical protein n=1 Tax=Vibrio sp. LaRot3 TaxID=2998829 RepID=UPI0022CDC2AB|nr:hypothetical protein [Vibrio sp. LaRot3]MDA0147337.1 hypothetical protein [Vibrio sp. LaRot3]
MKALPLVTLIFACSEVHAAAPIEIDWDWATSVQHTEHQESAFISPDKTSSVKFDALLDAQLSLGNWNGLFAIYGQQLYSSAHYLNTNHEYSDGWFEQEHTDLIIRELAWQGELTVGDNILDVTLGKVRVDWGVGYGYRPLDFFKPYAQNPIGLSVEEGALVGALSYFDQQGEWTAIYTNSHWSDREENAFTEANQQHGVGFRRYVLSGNSEYQWLAYYDDVREGLIGASWVTVLGEAWELHAESSWQNRYLQYQLPSQPYQSTALTEHQSAWQGLIGFTYTNMQGHSLIGEYWYDQRAWTSSQWDEAISQADKLASLPHTKSLASSYAQGLNHSNLVQHTLLLHWSWDTQAWAQWQTTDSWHWLTDFTPTLDLMYAPQDGGIIATQWLNYQWLDNGDASVELEFSARFLSGDNKSSYAQINDRRTLTLTIKGKF